MKVLASEVVGQTKILCRDTENGTPEPFATHIETWATGAVAGHYFQDPAEAMKDYALRVRGEKIRSALFTI